MYHPQIIRMIQLFEAESQPFRKVHRMIDLFETIIKTHSAVIVSNYFQQKDINEDIKGLLAQGLRVPSLGIWQVFSRVIMKEIKHLEQPVFIEGFVEYFEKWDKKYDEMKKKKNLIPGMMFIFFLLFVSMRSGMGIGMKQKYNKKEIIPNYTLIFKDNTRLDVRKVGQNSAYFFYFIPGEKVITATPIADNLKQIKVLKKKKK